ncbi:MAG: efflux RND transporter permease subunit [Candidatus Latescibacterota bacterium]|jgi:HAE1 family hydrophobic/amphiphilic exporter-1
MDDERRYRLPRFSVNRPVTVVMILLALLVVGAIAYTRIPLTLFPEGMDYPRLFVWANYPNAGAVEVEKKVVRHLEEAVAQVSSVKGIQSGANRGGGWVRAEFQKDTDLQVAFAEMKDRLERVMPEMPDEIEQLWVRRWDQNDIPILEGAITFGPGVTDPRFLIDTYIDPALRRIDGVGNVEVWGTEGKMVLVELDQSKVRSHDVNIFETVNELRSQNVTVPGGWIIEGGKKIYLRSMGRYESVDELSNTVIDPEHQLKLADVASVQYKPPRKDWVNRIDRQESLGFGIVRAAEANIVHISDEVHATMEELKQHPKLQGMDFVLFWDQGEHVTSSVYNLQASGLWGGMFAAMVLFFFLRAVRMTLIITLAIPLCIMVTITVLYFMGWSLNMATMMGLLLSLGLVVDNAIVIVENIFRKRQEGLDPRRASIEGAGEVGMAVTMATLTTVVVFLPLILMGSNDNMAFWMLRIGFPVIVGLVASLGIALVIIPLAALKIGSGRDRGELGFILWVRRRYENALRWVLTHRIDAFILVVLAMASVQIPMEGMKKTDQQDRNESRMDLAFEMPSGQSLEQAEAFMTSVEDSVMVSKEAYDVRIMRTFFRAGWGRVTMFFNEEKGLEWYEVAWDDLLKNLELREKLHLDYKEIEKDIKERLYMPPGITLRVNWENSQQDARVNVTLYGEDTQTLIKLAEEVERRMNSIPGLLSVNTDMDQGSTELQLKLDRGQMERLGVSAQMISGNIAYALRGHDINKFHTEDGREVDIRVQLEEFDRKSLQDLRSLTFPTADGREVPLESLANIFVERTLGGIRRDDRQTMLNVVARAPQDDAKELFSQVDVAMQGFDMPRGYRWDKGARYVRIEEQDDSMMFASIMSVTFVFLLMGVLFESFVLPLSVIISIPFSFLGVYWTLYLTDTPQDIMSVIGMVILIGVVVNNAIVLIDLANRLRDEGMDRMDALMEAGRHRFRPILMTTFTTAFGLIPMAVGNSKMVGLAYAPLGRTMMGGLLASTVLTLMLVPLFYTFFDDFRELVQKVMASAFAEEKEKVPETAG